MRGEGGTGSLTETREDVDDAWWETSLLGEACSDEPSERSLLSGLDDDCAAGGDGRANLPCPHEQWEVPWDDLRADTDWFLLQVVEGVGCGVDDLALDLVGPAAVVSQAADTHADVDLGHVGGLAIVESLNGGEELSVLLEEVGERAKQLATVLWSHLSPWAIESLACCGDGNVDILLGGLRNLAGHALVCWVVDLELLALYTLHELVVDEPGDCELYSWFATVINDPLTSQLAARTCRQSASQAELRET